ncbi:MCE family protein [Nocardia sp. NPDC087230]|uniref:MCE family protein n=1 Tax=Nocardia sp. NPDC087230 TaxID=3364331 RepID=UPI003825F12F
MVAVIALAATVTMAAAIVDRAGTDHVTVYFRDTTGLYAGDRVMILGVEVGTVKEIRPEGGKVRVELSYDNRHPVPADARAAIVAPTLVTGRYIQLAPAYTGGPKLADGATIGLDRTAVPVSFDEVKQQIIRLTQDVGATPGNTEGALNQFVSQTARTLNGNGSSLHASLVHLSEAMKTLGEGGGDLFATVRNLQELTTALATNDQEIVAFSSELANLSAFLNNNRTELDALLTSMQATFDQVTGFVEQHREGLRTDVDKLNTITGLLVDRVDTLMAILHSAPTTLSNFYNIYDPQSNSLTGAVAVPNLPDPKSLICALLTTANAPADECLRAGDAFVGALGSTLSEEPPR